MSKNQDIQFPFAVNERTRAAFRNSARLRQLNEAIVGSLLRIAMDMGEDGWDILMKEHPEVTRFGLLKYDYVTGTVDLARKNEKRGKDTL